MPTWQFSHNTGIAWHLIRLFHNACHLNPHLLELFLLVWGFQGPLPVADPLDQVVPNGFVQDNAQGRLVALSKGDYEVVVQWCLGWWILVYLGWCLVSTMMHVPERGRLWSRCQGKEAGSPSTLGSPRTFSLPRLACFCKNLNISNKTAKKLYCWFLKGN